MNVEVFPELYKAGTLTTRSYGIQWAMSNSYRVTDDRKILATPRPVLQVTASEEVDFLGAKVLLKEFVEIELDDWRENGFSEVATALHSLSKGLDKRKSKALEVEVRQLNVQVKKAKDNG